MIDRWLRKIVLIDYWTRKRGRHPGRTNAKIIIIVCHQWQTGYEWIERDGMERDEMGGEGMGVDGCHYNVAGFLCSTENSNGMLTLSSNNHHRGQIVIIFTIIEKNKQTNKQTNVHITMMMDDFTSITVFVCRVGLLIFLYY